MEIVSREAEVKLIEAVTDIRESSHRWVAVCFHFSQLLEHYRNESQLKIAVNMISGQMSAFEGTLYQYDDGSIYVMIEGGTPALAEKMVFQLRYLFMDDPLAYTGDGEENPAFSNVYDLGEHYDEFVKLCKSRLTQKIKSRGRESGPESISPKELPDHTPIKKKDRKSAKKDGIGGDIQFFNASSLARIEKDLANADITKVVRRQPICAAVPETITRRVFDELYVNVSHLRKVLGVDVDLLSNRWLFKYLTQVLDDRMLDLLQRNPNRYLDNPISLNLNIHTLLSNRFAEFDASIKPAVKVSIVIEIQLADVFNDMAAFLVAKDAVQKLGYRVCLDGVTDLSFMQIDRKKLGFDLVKLQWNANISSEVGTASNLELSEAIKSCGVNRVILTRCDTRDAVDYGQAMGVSLFQGRYLDAMMDPRSSVEN